MIRVVQYLPADVKRSFMTDTAQGWLESVKNLWPFCSTTVDADRALVCDRSCLHLVCDRNYTKATA